MYEDRIRKLPRWAQDYIELLQRDLKSEQEEHRCTRQAHALLSEHRWFTLQGPVASSGRDYLKLFTLGHDGAFPVCTLFSGDLLIIGRKKP